MGMALSLVKTSSGSVSHINGASAVQIGHVALQGITGPTDGLWIHYIAKTT